MDAKSEAVRLIAVLVGGAVGSGCRYILGRLALYLDADAIQRFPWHTFGINVLGSFALGLAAVLLSNRPGWLLLLGTGFCGGFTTFSTFSVETLLMLENHRPLTAAGYALGSLALGLIAAWAAMHLARG